LRNDEEEKKRRRKVVAGIRNAVPRFSALLSPQSESFYILV
jgi:hypothetical protein